MFHVPPSLPGARVKQALDVCRYYN